MRSRDLLQCEALESSAISGKWIERTELVHDSTRSRIVTALFPLRKPQMGSLRWSKLTILCALTLGCGNNHVEPELVISADASAYLANVMDRFHKTLDVYTDADAAGNHFVARGRFSSPGDADAVLPMNESSRRQPHSGVSCIEATFRSQGHNWGGWYFMNGVLDGKETAPRENWGDQPNAGLDLSGNTSGSTKLSFWAVGAEGFEFIEFFCGGVGWSAEKGEPTAPFPDSSPRRARRVFLTQEWRQYEIDLSNTDLSYVLGGFGWVVDADWNQGRDVHFFLDDIQFNQERL
jgi:hypothetical protein